MSDTSNTRWQPAQYEKFSGPRLRPALDLLHRVTLEEPRLIYDLGCGTGDVTRILANRFADAEVIGVDSSSEMLARANEIESPANWLETDIASFEPSAPADLLYSNAALHWLGDHADLFPRLARSLKVGGVLAVQIPQSWGQESHRLMRSVLEGGNDDASPLGSPALRESLAEPWVLKASTYFEILSPHLSTLDIWQTEYLHVLTGEDPVLEWVKGTGLRPILDGLEKEDLDRFLDLYRGALRRAYPRLDDGSTLYPFGRLFIVGRR